MPGVARADCHGDGTPNRPAASGRNAAADVPSACRRPRTSPLICARPSSAVSGSREPAWPRMQGPCPAVQRQPGHADPARLGRPAGRRAGICGAQSLYIKVRSVSCDQAEPARAQQVAVARPADPAGLYRPDNLACRPGAVRGPARASRHRRRRCRSRGLQRSGGAGSHESRDMGPARHGRWRTVSRPAARPSRPARGVLPGA